MPGAAIEPNTVPSSNIPVVSTATVTTPPVFPGVAELAAEMLRQMKADGLVMQASAPSTDPQLSQASSTTAQIPAVLSRPTSLVATSTVTAAPELATMQPTASASTEPSFGISALANLTGTPALNTSESLPLNSISRPLDVNVDIRLKQKIWAEQFVDFGALVQTKQTETYELTMDANNLALIPKSRAVPIRSMEQWNLAFQIFVTIVVQGKPELAAPLMKYAHIVQHIGKRAGDQAAIMYDINFRKWRQASPHLLPYDQANTELYLEAMTSQSAFGAKTNKGSNKGSNGQSSPSAPQNKVCYAFQKKGACNRPNCWFKHACRDCGGNHSFRKCHGNKVDSSHNSSSNVQSSGGKPKSTNTNK